MPEAIVYRQRRMRLYPRAVQGLQEKVTEIEITIVFRIDPILREQEFQLVSGPHEEPGAGFRADADPVNAGRHRQSPVCLHCNLETRVVEGGDEGFVELKQGLSSGRDQQPLDARSRRGKKGRRSRCKLSRITEDAASRSIRTHKIRVTVWAGRPGSVLNVA